MSLNRAAVAASGADMSVSDVASATGLSQTLIYREISCGNLIAYKVGKVLRVEHDAYADWKQRCTVRPRGETPTYEIGRLAQESRGTSANFAARLSATDSAKDDEKNGGTLHRVSPL